MINEQISAEDKPRKNERQSANWDIRNAPKNYLSLVLSQGGSAFFAFASVWLISKTIGSEGYGGVVAIIAASQVAQILVSWTSIAVVRFGTEEFIETSKIARAFWMRLFILLPNILLVWLAAGIWFPPLANWLKLPPGSFGFVLFHFVASAFWIHLQNALQGAKLPRVQGFLMMCERFLSFAGIVILIALGKLTPLFALICYSVAPVLMVVIAVFYLRNFIFARFSVDAQFLKKIIAYSVPLLPFSLIGYFSGSYVDAIFVSKFLSTSDLGIYSVATQMNGIGLQLPTLANSLLIPFFITLHKENFLQKLNGYFENVLPALTLVWGALCVFGMLAGYIFIPLIFGREFSAAVIPFSILLSASVAAIPLLCGYSALTHANSVTYIAAIISVVSAVVNIALNYLLIPQFGMEGCAWATFFSASGSTAGFALLLNLKVKMRVSWVFFAVIPHFCGTALYSYTKNIWLGLLTGLVLTLLVAFIYRRSLFSSFQILKSIGKR